jgi:oligopeptide/dipeptide ABC transporter ATP-binding protein
MAEPPLLEAVELGKRFRSKRRHPPVVAVDGVSFAVAAGRTLALVGESGCGKSTVGRLLLDLETPDHGEVRLRGRRVDEMSREERRDFRRSVQMVFQNPLTAFNPMLSIEASLQDAMRLRDDLGRDARNHLAETLMRRVRLDPGLLDRRPAELSGGQLQRVGIARALATEPAVLFLDEPTSALDMSVRGQVLELLLELQEQTGVAYVLVSHDLRVVRAVAHDVHVMYLGHVVERGSLGQVLDEPLHPYTRGLVQTAHLGDRAGRLPVRGELRHLPEGYAGCRLLPRCPYRLPACREPQALDEKRPSHAARCWRAIEIEGKPPPAEPAIPPTVESGLAA